MARSIEALREQLTGGAALDESALHELEQHYSTNGDELSQLFVTYREIVESVTDVASVRVLRRRLVKVLDGVLGDESNEATRGTLRRRKGELLTSLEDGDAIGELAQAFRELPDEQVLDALGGFVDLDAQPALKVDVLRARFKLAGEPGRRAIAALELGAQLLGDQQLDEAEEMFQSVLELEPGDETATGALTTITEIREARQAMLDELRADVEAGKGTDKVPALLALAEAIFDDGGDEAEAVAAVEQACELVPGNGDAASLLLSRYVADERWDDIATAGDRWIEAASSDDKLEALRTVGVALLDGGEDFTEPALAHLQAAHKLNAADPGTVDGLNRALSALERHDELVAVLQAGRRASRVRKDERRWLVREAEIVWRHQGLMDKAEKMFRRVRASDPRDMTALLFYEDHLSQKGDWKRLHAILSQKFTLVAKESRVDVASQMADIAENKMSNLAKAIEAYKRVLIEDPSNLRGAEHLVELYRKTGKWHALIEFLNSQIRRLGAQDIEARVALLFQIIDVYQDPDKLPVEEMVIHTYNRIVQVSPTNVVALDNLAQRYEDSRRWSELVKVLQKKIHATTDAEMLLDLFHQVADLYLSKMSSESQAIPFLERILELDPTNLDVVRKLRSIYKAKHNLERLYGTYEAELNLLEGKKREPVLTELAVLATDKLYWQAQAIEHWEELLGLNPKNEKAVTSLYALYAQDGRWEKYVELLESRLELARTKRKKVEILGRIGQIRFEKLDQVDEAVKTYKQILKTSAHNAAARKALQRIYISAQDWDALKALYAEQKDWTGYIAFLDETASQEDDPVLAAEIQLEVVRVFEEKLKKKAKAVERLEQVLEKDAQNVDVAAMLDERYSALKETEKRVPVLQVIADYSQAPAAVIEALRMGVELLLGGDKASDALDWAMKAVDAGIDEGQLEGVDQLEELADKAERLEDLSAWYGDAATRVGAPEDRTDLLKRHAELLRHRLRKNADAIEVYEELSRADDVDWDTLKNLEELTRSERDWQALERVLQREITVLDGSTAKKKVAQRRVCRLQLGQLYEDIIDDPDQAIACYRAILAEKAGDPEAVEGLDRIFSLEELWEELLALLEGELERAEEPVSLMNRIAGILYENVGDPSGAIDRLQQALDVDPVNAETVKLLDKLFDADESRERVSGMLSPVLREIERYDRLVEVLSDGLGTTEDPDDRRALLADIATLREEKLKDAAGAFVLRAEQVALMPSDVAARGEFERLAEELSQWPDVAALYAVAVGLEGVEAPLDLGGVVPLEDTNEETALTRRLAEIYEVQVEELDRATECYERVHTFDPEDLDILAALERLHARRQDWDAMLAILRVKAELTWEVDDKKAVYLEICQLLRDELDRPEDAIEFYRMFLELDEGNLEVIGELESLFAEFERWEDLVDLMRRRIGLVDNKDARIEILFELSVVFRDRLEDVDKAIDTFGAILTDEPDHEETITALEALLLREDLGGYDQFALRVADIVQPWFHEKGEWQREIKVIQVRAALAADDVAKAKHLCSVGQRTEDKGDSLEEAFGFYAEAFKLDPANEDATAALKRSAETLQCWEDWADVLEEGARDDEPSVAVPVLMTVGGLCREQLADDERAIKTFTRILDMDPVHAGALEALDELYDVADNATERVAILERRAESAEHESTRRALMFEVGKIHQALGNTEDAISGFAYVAEHGDAAMEEIAAEALDQLQQLYTELEDWMQLVGVLLAKADVAGDDEQRIGWLLEAASTQEQKLSNTDEAIKLYEQVCEVETGHPSAFDNLARLLDAAERWDDLEELFLGARAVAGPDAANKYDFMLGQLYDHRLGRAEDAINHYEAILDRTPDFVPALKSLAQAMDIPEHGLRASEVLLRAHSATDNAGELAGVLTKRLESWPDEIELSATHIQLAKILESEFSDAEKAFDNLCQAAIINWVEPPELRDDLVRLAEETERWDELEVVDREVLDAADDDLERVAVLMEMARVARFHREDGDAAEARYREVLEIDAGHADSLDALREIYEESGRSADIVEVLQVKAELAGDGAEKIAILYQIGALQLGELDEKAAAIETYEQIVALEPLERDAYRQIEQVYALQEAWDEVVAVLGRELDVLDDQTDRVATRRRMAEILYHKAEDRDRALDEVTALLEVDTEHATALSILEAALADGHAYDRVIRHLVPIYESVQNWEKLIALYESHAERSETAGQLWALEEIRRIQLENKNDAGAAYDAFKRIVRLAPEDSGRRGDLENMARGLRKHADVAAFYGTLLDDNPDAGYAVPVALKAAALYEDPLHDTDKAIEKYRFVLEREVTNETALPALSKLFEADERWDELAELQGRAVDEVLDAGERRRLLFEQARLYMDRLEQPEKAVESLQRALDENPDSREALARLEGLYSELERWEDTEDLYRQWLEVAEPPDETTAVRYRLALFAVDQRADYAMALDELERTIGEKPDHGLSVALLERIVGHVELPEPEAAQVGAQAAELLAKLYDKETPWESWAAVHRARLAAAEEPRAKMKLHTQLGDLLLKRAEDPEQAFAQYGAAFTLDFGSEKLTRKLETLAKKHELWDALVVVYEQGLDEAPDDDIRSRYLLKVATINREHLANAAAAAAVYEQLLEINPSDGEALGALESYYEEADAWKDLARVARLRLDTTHESADRIAILYRIASLELDQLGNQDNGVEALREILSMDASEKDAKDMLEWLHSAREEWADLVQVFRWKLDYAEENDERIDLLSKTAQIQERQLMAPEDAVTTYREILETSPQNLYAITSLERLYPEIEDWAGMLEILERKRGLFQAPRDRVDVDFQMGGLLFDRLGEPERALEHFRMVLSESPEHEGVIEYLEKMLENENVRMPTSFVLEPIYEQRQDWARLGMLLEVQLTDAEEPQEQVDLLKRLAELRDQDLDDPDGAIAALGQAFQLDPHDAEVRDGLTSVADRSERWEALSAVYHEALAAVTDVDVTREVSGWLAELSEKHLNDPEGAVDRYMEVLRYDQFNVTALTALSRLLEEQSRWEELVDVLRTMLAEASGDAVRKQRTKLAEVLLQHVNEPEEALQLYKELLWEDPNDADALEGMAQIAAKHAFLRDAVTEILKPIHQGAERYDEVIRLMLISLQSEEDLFARAHVYRQVAELYDTHVGDPVQAFNYYTEALKADPSLDDVLREIDRLAASQERWAELGQLYDAMVEQTDSEDTLKVLLMKSGRIAQRRLGQEDVAVARFKRVLEYDAEHYEALEALEEVYESQGKIRELIAVCEVRARLPIEVAERVSLYRKMAKAALYRQDTEKAEECWLALLDVDASDVEALQALEALYRDKSDYDRLAETMDRRASVTEDEAELVAIKVELGKQRVGHLDDQRGAVDAYEEALELDPTCLEALAALDVLYEDLNEWEELARVLAARVELADGAASQITLLTRLAMLHEVQLGRVDDAIENYEQVLKVEPMHSQTIDELVRIYHKYERWDGLVDVYERKIGLTEVASEQIALKIKSAEVYEGRLKNVDRATELLQEVLALDPKNPAALRLQARLMVVNENPEEAIATYEALLPTLETDKERISAHLALGKLYLEAWDNTAKALVCFRDALALDEDHPEANSLLKDILYRRESWEAVVPVLEREYKRAEDRKKLADIAHELAVLQRDRLGEPAESYKWLRAGYNAKRDHKPIVEDLVEYYTTRDMWDDAAPLLAWLVSYLEAKRMYGELAGQAHRLGALYERTGDEAKALRYYQVANQYDSRNVPNLLALGRLLHSVGKNEKALQTFQSLLLLQHDIEDDAVKVEMFLSLAKVCSATGDKTKARRHLKRLLALDREHAEANALLEKL